MKLPTDETPTIATVSDPGLLKNPFYSKAKAGDVVIIYYGIKKALLYDPVAKEIINITNVNIGDFSRAPI